MQRMALGLVLALAGCNKHDNSSDTERSRDELSHAQTTVSEKITDVATRTNDIEGEKRELARRQQKLVDDEQALATRRDQLGSAREVLTKARETYAAAVRVRLSKLDATLAALETPKDAASKDALVGLRARREQLVTKIAAMSGTAEPSWDAYMLELDTTFDAIERDLHDAR